MANTLKAAALQLAKAGYKIFPVPPGTKKSYISKSNVRFGSGENWGMTNDPVLIEKYWNKWPNANIGFPTGFVNGRIVVETDTKAGHIKLTAEGEEALQALEKRLGKLPPTLMSESPSGSIHYWFEHPGAEKRITGGAAKLGTGIDVLGDGQMAVVPPSRRGDKVYKWRNKLPPARLPPQWLKALGEAAQKPTRTPKDVPDNPYSQYGAGEEDYPSVDEIKIELDGTKNEDLHWDFWNEIAMRVFASSRDKDAGLILFTDWSKRSSKYDRNKTREKWRLLHTSPPTEYGPRAIFYRSEGWPDETPEAEEKRIKSTKHEPKSKSKLKEEVNGKHHALGENSELFIDVEPFNFWEERKVPDLPVELLPKVIGRFAVTVSNLQGSDPAGVALGALLGCGVAIPDCYKLQPKLHDPWADSPRIWVALVGGVSVMKSPVTRAVLVPFRKIEKELMDAYLKDKMAWDELSAEEKQGLDEPQLIRILLNDTTSQGAQNVLRYSKDGILCSRDEMSGFFGGMDQYSKGGGGNERAFWLECYDGQSDSVTRADRNRSFRIENKSVSFFGGVQPAIIRQLDNAHANDGLIQRMITLMLRDSVPGKDEPSPPVAEEYDTLIQALYHLPRDRSGVLKFTPEGREVYYRVERKEVELKKLYVHMHPKLADHIGKYKGIFVRLCLIFHMIEHHTDIWETGLVGVDIAERVYKFMFEFLVRHAEVFYMTVLDAADDYDRMKSIAGYMLAHEKIIVSNRDMHRGVHSMRGLKSREIEEIFEQLYALGWVAPKGKVRSDAPRWAVNPQALYLFKEHAEEEKRMRKAAIQKLAEIRKAK